jgi:hypothetical protein
MNEAADEAFEHLNIPRFANLSISETKSAKWRRESVPVGLRVKGFEAPVYDGAFSSIYTSGIGL